MTSSQQLVSGRVTRPRALLVQGPADLDDLSATRRPPHVVDGLDHVVAPTVADATRLLARGSFDIVLVDLRLPDVAGPAVVAALTQAHPSVPVVALLASDDDGLVADALAAGAHDHLVEGRTTPDMVLRAIRHARERHRLSAALTTHEDGFRAMADSARDGIYRCRLHPRVEVEYLNPAVAELTGLPLADLRDDPGLALRRVHPDDRHELERDLLDPARACSATVRFQRADGEWVMLEDRRAPLVVDGEVVAVQGIIRDVTTQQRTTQALHDALRAERQAAEHLRATNDMKGQFLQAMSHELRTPLTSILGFSEILIAARSRLTPEQLWDVHSRLRDNALRLQFLLSDLLDLERLTHAGLRIDRQESDVAAIARRIAEELEQGMRHVVVEQTPCVADVDPSLVERIVRNLLANAIKHTQPTATVTVRCTQDPDVVRITVADDGPGIPEHLRDLAFEPFWQGPAMLGAPSPGSGVGLSVVRQFAVLHGGHAWLETTPGGGTTAQVELGLPVQVDEKDHLAPPIPLGRGASTSDADWALMPVEHRRSLRRAMVDLLTTTTAVDATGVVVDHLLRIGATVRDEGSEEPGDVIVQLAPQLAVVRASHPDATARTTLPGQVEVLTGFARHALASSGRPPAPPTRIAPPDVAAGPVPDAPAPAPSTRVDDQAVVLWATRELLTADTVEELVGIVLRTVHALGGAVLPAALEDEDALPLDLTLGRGEPMLPVAAPGSRTREHLERHLPGLVADARGVAGRLRAQGRPAADWHAGLATRQQFERLLVRLRADDVVVSLDLAGVVGLALDRTDAEAVAHGFAKCLLEHVRDGDHAARVGDHAFVLLMRGAGRAGACDAIARLRAEWEQQRTHPVGIMAGCAVGADHDWWELRDVDRAMSFARSGSTDAGVTA